MQTFVEKNIQASNSLQIRQLTPVEILVLNLVSMIPEQCSPSKVLALLDGRHPLTRSGLGKAYRSLVSLGLMVHGWRLTYTGYAYLAACVVDSPRTVRLIA